MTAGTDFLPLNLVSKDTISAQTISSEKIATQHKSDEGSVQKWLEQLLKHFSVQELDTLSIKEVASYLSVRIDDASPVVSDEFVSRLATELKRRVMRLAGVQLDTAFVSMAAHVIDESTLASASLSVEGRQLKGVRYQSEVYRQVETFKLCHRLQAYCLAQTLSEQHLDYLITRSHRQFAVWVKLNG